LALIWIVETSDTFKDCIHQTKNDKTEHTLYQRISNFSVIFSRRQDCLGVFVHSNEGAITAFATLLIAIFTLTLWRSTDKLWDASKRQLAHSEDTAKRQLRAYVAATITGCDDPKTEDGIFTFHLEIKNTGQTPAHDLKVIFRTAVIDHPFSENFDFTIPDMENASVSALGAGRITLSRSPSDPMTPDTWKQISSENSGKRLCTYGTITYRDIFNDPQYTNICSVHLIEIDQKTGRMSVTGRVADRHNDAS
jgi:hypothetical protein